VLFQFCVVCIMVDEWKDLLACSRPFGGGWIGEECGGVPISVGVLCYLWHILSNVCFGFRRALPCEICEERL
jgi:hypothetical protein